ncbi:MAG: DUF6456 domain-containing protein [Pseudomonadota bacterium]
MTAVDIAAQPSNKASRRIRGVLKLLVEQGALIVPLQGEDDYVVVRPGEEAHEGRMKREAVQAMEAQNLIARHARAPECFEATEAAAAAYRRMIADADPMRAQHWPLGDQKAPEGRARFVGDSPLAWLRRRKGGDGAALISAAEYDAGERLREDFTCASLSPRVTCDLSAVVVASGRRGPADGLTDSERALAAKRRLEQALDAVGPQLSGVLISVCCHLQGLEDAERGFGWPQRSGKVVLKLALERLAVHYGYVQPARRAAFRAWRAEGARPAI